MQSSLLQTYPTTFTDFLTCNFHLEQDVAGFPVNVVEWTHCLNFELVLREEAIQRVESSRLWGTWKSSCRLVCRDVFLWRFSVVSVRFGGLMWRLLLESTVRSNDWTPVSLKRDRLTLVEESRAYWLINFHEGGAESCQVACSCGKEHVRMFDGDDVLSDGRFSQWWVDLLADEWFRSWLLTCWRIRVCEVCWSWVDVKVTRGRVWWLLWLVLDAWVFLKKTCFGHTYFDVPVIWLFGDLVTITLRTLVLNSD